MIMVEGVKPSGDPQNTTSWVQVGNPLVSPLVVNSEGTGLMQELQALEKEYTPRLQAKRDYQVQGELIQKSLELQERGLDRAS